MTPHNEAKKNEIAKTVLMPGDPLRAKYIADNFLKNVKTVNSVRNMYGYTGEYKDKKITVFASGMGMPSMGIYSYELYKFYDVENIIRIGSCGAYSPDLNLFDTILVDKSYTEGNFSYALEEKECHIASSCLDLNNIIKKTISNIKLENKVVEGNTICTDVFDYYVKDLDSFVNRFPKELNIIAAEMEAFALFYTAKFFNKKASCLLTVVDSYYKKEHVTADKRERALNDMIKLALESAIQL